MRLPIESFKQYLLEEWDSRPSELGANIASYPDVDRIISAMTRAYKAGSNSVCNHVIVDARNKAISSGYVCIKCFTVFESGDHGPPVKRVFKPYEIKFKNEEGEVIASWAQDVDEQSAANHFNKYNPDKELISITPIGNGNM